MTDLAIGLILVLSGVIGGLLIGYLLLKLLIPPLISRAFEARESYKKKANDAGYEMKYIKEKLNSKVNSDDRKKAINDISDYFDTYYPDGFPGG